MVLSDLGCGSGSFDLAPFSCASLYTFSYTAQTDVLSAVTSLAGGGGMTRVQSNAQCAQAASSGRLVVAKPHARFHFGRVGFETRSRTQLSHTHTTWSHIIFHTHNFVTRIFHTHNFITHKYSSHTTSLTYRSSTTSFVFPSFPIRLQLLLLLTGRS